MALLRDGGYTLQGIATPTFAGPPIIQPTRDLKPPEGSSAFADFVRDVYFIGSSPALFDEILVADPPNWGAWSKQANIPLTPTGQPIGLVYDEATTGVPLFAPGLLPAMFDGFSLVMFCSMTNLPPPTQNVTVNGDYEIGVRIFTSGPMTFENLNVGYSIWNTGVFGSHGALFYTSIDDFGGVYKQAILDPFHHLNDTFKIGLTVTPEGVVTSVADRFDPLQGDGVQLVHVVLPNSYAVDDWAGIVLYFIDSNLENPQRWIIEQLTVYTPPLLDADLFAEVQTATQHFL